MNTIGHDKTTGIEVRTTELKKRLEIILTDHIVAGYIKTGIGNILEFWNENKNAIPIPDACLDFLRLMEKWV
jgi:hypothetical protein